MDSFSFIIFGITGNLAQIKLIPALYDLVAHNLLPKNTALIGLARTPMTKQAFNRYIYDVLHQQNPHHQHPIEKKYYQELCRKFHYLSGNLTDPNLYHHLRQLRQKHTIIYLATYPDLYEGIFQNLQASGLSDQSKGWVRIIIEKPIGINLSSAQALNHTLLKYFAENQIFRLDHYLGKETLQNIINFRFGNDIFEPLINSKYVDHIQVTATEDFGIGKRGGYYDSVGALKDVGQNHLLQMLALATMEAPPSFDTKAITKSRIRLLDSLIPLPRSLVLGQYASYKQEPHVDPKSTIDTYFAFKTFIDNDRFHRVPIYVRGGKKLARTATEISIVFKLPTSRLFNEIDSHMEPNVLIYRLQPNEGIVLKILTKTPGYAKKTEPAYMQFCYKSLSGYIPDPYERLIYDVIQGDQTFFNDAPEVETQWAFIDQLTKGKHPLHRYKAGSWGPKAADLMLQKDHCSWLEPSAAFCQF